MVKHDVPVCLEKPNSGDRRLRGYSDSSVHSNTESAEKTAQNTHVTPVMAGSRTGILGGTTTVQGYHGRGLRGIRVGPSGLWPGYWACGRIRLGQWV